MLIAVNIPDGKYCQLHRAPTKAFPFNFEGHYRCPIMVLRRCALCKGRILNEPDYKINKSLAYRIIKDLDCPNLKEDE